MRKFSTGGHLIVERRLDYWSGQTCDSKEHSSDVKHDDMTMMMILGLLFCLSVLTRVVLKESSYRLLYLSENTGRRKSNNVEFSSVIRTKKKKI